MPPTNFFEPQLKILCSTTNSFLFSNFANTIEGSYLSSGFFKDLIASGIIKFYAEKQSLDEYWESSAVRYTFDKERYPYIKDTLNGEIKMEPYFVRDFSMTNKLKSRLFELNQSNEDNISLLKSFNEKNEFWKLVTKISKHKGDEAVTMSLAAQLTVNGKSSAKLTLNNLIGRLLSYLYLEEILKPIQADIATGIGDLSFFDQASEHFPSFDVPLLDIILKSCGFNLNEYHSLELILYRNSLHHNFNSIYISSILKTLFILEGAKKEKTLIRASITQIILQNKIPKLHSEKPKLEELSGNLILLVSKLSNSYPLFKETFQKNYNMKTVLVLTATSKETAALNENARQVFGNEGTAAIKGNHAVTLLGIMNGYEIWHGQCEAGSGGPSGAQAIATDLIDALGPKCVLMPGIAFGLKQDDQEIGNILVSTHVYTYEKERAGESSLPRPDKVPASPKLLSVLRMVDQKWKKTKMHFGTLMSGEKLVDNQELVEKLKKLEPEAIGGEMEGAGIYAAAYRRNVEWIIFKSIVDWGFKKTNVHQVGSSSLASEVLFEALKIITLE